MLHTPGHAPGRLAFYAADLGCVFSGDTLFNSGPGATGRSFSDEGLIKSQSMRAVVRAAGRDRRTHRAW
ncbi:MAG: MBL fold metallo-hydrolase [Nocardioidaceae bacterium]